MLATPAERLPADVAAWAAEPKWDGFRTIAQVAGGTVRLRSRRGLDMAAWLPELHPLADALAGHTAALDGELVAFGPDGRPDFARLQRRRASRRTPPAADPVTLLLFDLLFWDGELLLGRPYAERRERLDALGLAGPAWQTSPSFPGQAPALLAATAQQGLEGILVKHLDSRYEPGRRSRWWLKLTHWTEAVFTIGAFVPGPRGVAALLVGIPDPERPGRLRFTARVDAGLVPASRARLAALLVPLHDPRNPFEVDETALATAGRGGGRPVLVRPEVRVVVRFLGWEAGRLRHPAYRRLHQPG
jgi:bifunctional non-homologous end joining protein LigD